MRYKIKSFFKNSFENNNIVSNILSSKTLNQKIINNSTIVFLFHSISDNPSKSYQSNALHVKLNNFKFQIDYIKSNFNIISPLDIDKKYTKPAALITFDDGLLDYYTNAVPILNKLNVPSINFINFYSVENNFNIKLAKNFLKIKKISYVDKSDKEYNEQSLFESDKYKLFLKTNDLYDEFIIFQGNFLSLKELSEFENYSNVYIGNHLYEHFRATKIDDNLKKYQYQTNKIKLQKYKNYLDYFSYPFGRYNIDYNKDTDKLFKNLAVKKIFYADFINSKINSKCISRLVLMNTINSEKLFRKHIALSLLKSNINKFSF